MRCTAPNSWALIITCATPGLNNLALVAGRTPSTILNNTQTQRSVLVWLAWFHVDFLRRLTVVSQWWSGFETIRFWSRYCDQLILKETLVSGVILVPDHESGVHLLTSCDGIFWGFTETRFSLLCNSKLVTTVLKYKFCVNLKVTVTFNS